MFVFYQRQLEDDVSDDLIKGSSKYIVNLIFEVLRDMFSSARELQVSAKRHIHL